MKNLKMKIIFGFIFLFFFTSCETLSGLLGGGFNGSKKESFTNAEAIEALKDALVVGAKYASSDLGRKDGYFKNSILKIAFPPEAKVIVDNIEKIPYGQRLLDDLVLRINRSAEETAKEIVPIFSGAVKEMTIKDGIEIVYGKEDAATAYLKEKTHKKLLNLFAPKMKACLAKPLVAGVSADKAWKNLITAYNTAGKIPNGLAKLKGEKEPMPEVNPDMAEFATDKALDGIFYKVAEEEKKIRKSPLEYASNMIKKVFGAIL